MPPPLASHDSGLPATLAEALPAGEPAGWRSQPLMLVVVSGLIATLLLVLLVRRLEEKTARTDFVAAAEERFTLLDASIQRALDGLVAVGAFYDATPVVGRSQFANLVHPILARQPALQALEWVPYTPGGELAALRDATRREGLTGFEIRALGPDGQMHPAQDRAEYFPVVFVEPLKGNERALGFDLGSNPARFNALDAARRQGRFVATSRITLVQESGRQFGFLVFRPVYWAALAEGVGNGRGLAAAGPPAPLASVAVPTGALPASFGRLSPDPASLRGYALGVFRVGQLIGVEESRGHGRPFDLFVFDDLGRPGEQRLYPSDSSIESAAALMNGPGVTHHIEVGGRAWTAIALPAGGSLHPDRVSSFGLLGAGLMLTALLAILQHQNHTRTQAIEETVASRTADLRASERQLIQANQEALQANRLKTVFLASMSHEFRTPMNAVLGLLHVLGRTPLDETQRDHIDKISSASRRLLRLIDDILDVSRIEAGQLSVEQVPFLLEAVLRDVLVAVAPKLRDKPVEFVLDLDPALPGQLIGDAMRLTQVLVNLTDNAAKFTQRGTITLSLHVRQQGEQRFRLAASVRDSGVGLSRADCARLFQPFVQTENSRSRRFGGTGLGLAICRQLVNLMGGDIHVESSPGVGSVFSFEIPFTVAGPVPIIAPGAVDGPRRVLVLEAHEGSATALLRQLRACGAVAEWAGDASAASRQLLAGSFDLLLVAGDFPSPALRSPPAGAVGSPVADPTRIRLVSIGASLRGPLPENAIEKPVLPSQLLALLQRKLPSATVADVDALAAGPEESVEACRRPASDGLGSPQTPLRSAQPGPSASGEPGTSSADPARDPALPAELVRGAAQLRALLLRGDPAAEDEARRLAAWGADTPYARQTNDLLHQCRNFDFREALLDLDRLCPPAPVSET